MADKQKIEVSITARVWLIGGLISLGIFNPTSWTAIVGMMCLWPVYIGSWLRTVMW